MRDTLQERDENLMRNPPKVVYEYDFWVRKTQLEV